MIGLGNLDPNHPNGQIFNLYDGELASWRKRAIRLDNFYRGKQYDTETADKMRRAGLLPVAIDMIRPLIAQMASIITSSRPTWKVVPIQGASKEVADIAGRFLIGKWNSDYVDLQYDLAVIDSLITGMGWLYVDTATFLDNAPFDIVIKRLHWKNVYPDPMAQEFDLSDADNIIIKKETSFNKLQSVFKLTENQIGDALNIHGDIKRAWVLERFSKYPVNEISYTVNDKYKSELRNLPPKIFYTDNLKRKKSEESRNYYKDLKSLEVDGKISLQEYEKLHIYRLITVGNAVVFEGIMNITDYPLVLVSDEFSGGAKDIQGEASFIEGIQQYVNKFYMLTFHNAMLTGNSGWTAPKGSITDIAKWQKASSIPGAVKEYTPDPNMPNNGKPEKDQPVPINNAFFTLGQDLLNQGARILSIFNPVSGNPSGLPETFSTVESLQNFGSQRLKRLARKYDVILSKVGEVALQYIQNYSDVNELLTYIDDRTHIDGQINPNYGEEQEVGTLNQMVADYNGVLEIKNDSRIGKLKLKVLTQPNLGSDRQNKAIQLSNMVMNKALPATPGVMKTLFNLMEIPNYQAIIAELEQQGASEEQLQQAMQQIQVAQKQIEFLTKEADKLAKQLEISDFRNELDRELMRIKIEAQKNISKAQQDVQALISKTNTGKPNGTTD